MKVSFKTSKQLLRPLLIAALTGVFGLVLLHAPFGETWINTSYDYLFRFASRATTNRVVVVLMDNDAFDHFQQERERPWDRGLHARLLNRLAEDGCALVVLDAFLRVPRDPASDAALATAMRRQRAVVLMAGHAEIKHPSLIGARPTPPCEPFLSSAANNWGVAGLDPDADGIVRRHWPYPSPGSAFPSLPWAAAQVMGAQLGDKPIERWFRYYGEKGDWLSVGYAVALNQPTNFFRDKIVFIGTQPKTTLPGDESDEFLVPYGRWTKESTAGVEIMVTTFLNLMNRDWLRRASPWCETLGVVVSGGLLGFALLRFHPTGDCLIAIAFALLVAVAGILCSYLSNYWFPWLVVAGGQAPVALALRLGTRKLAVTKEPSDESGEIVLNTPDYELLHPPFGQGAYGKVWLARNAIGQWQALKVIYRAKFGDDPAPYEREFNGIEKYKPISDQHPGLLRVDFVSQRKQEGYFYYVMELGDSRNSSWRQDPSSYKPRDLSSDCRSLPGRRLPVGECVDIGIALADALEFLHQRGLTHRDIKPQNVLYVNGRPKLADMGLIANIRGLEEARTCIGTPGYMPPAPEMPGTAQADVYALGMLLYVLSTGCEPSCFPQFTTTLANSSGVDEYLMLNAIILKSCERDISRRFKSAAELLARLRKLRDRPKS